MDDKNIKVENEIAYHIHRLGKYDEYWEKGEEISFGESETNMDKLDEKRKEECENAFEEIRLKDYSTCPPRNKCLFVCNENNIQAWYNILTKGKEGSKLKSIKIFEVELTGNLFWGDASIYEDYCDMTDTKSIVDYWEGKINQKDKVEGLFVGHVRIIAEHEPKNFEVQLTKVVTVKITTPTEKVNNDDFFNFDNYQ